MANSVKKSIWGLPDSFGASTFSHKCLKKVVGVFFVHVCLGRLDEWVVSPSWCWSRLPVSPQIIIGECWRIIASSRASLIKRFSTQASVPPGTWPLSYDKKINPANYFPSLRTTPSTHLCSPPHSSPKLEWVCLRIQRQFYLERELSMQTSILQILAQVGFMLMAAERNMNVVHLNHAGETWCCS